MGVSSIVLIPTLLFLETNPLTPYWLLITALFQIGFLGSGVILIYLKIIPAIVKRQGMHLILPEERASINKVMPLWIVFREAKLWYNHMWWSLLSTMFRAGGLLLITIVTAILLTDIGWPIAFERFPTWMALIMARSAGEPNGAHLLSYIPVALFGLWIAWRFREPVYSVSLDVYNGILMVAFLVAFHEGVWLIAYFSTYYNNLNLGLLTNVSEDILFSLMVMMFIYAFWKYPFRKVSMQVFKTPLAIYSAYVFGWWLTGLPVTTINNWQIGKGPYFQTVWWSDPIVNVIEIGGWLLTVALFYLVIRNTNQTIRA